MPKVFGRFIWELWNEVCWVNRVESHLGKFEDFPSGPSWFWNDWATWVVGAHACGTADVHVVFLLMRPPDANRVHKYWQPDSNRSPQFWAYSTVHRENICHNNWQLVNRFFLPSTWWLRPSNSLAAQVARHILLALAADKRTQASLEAGSPLVERVSAWKTRWYDDTSIFSI